MLEVSGCILLSVRLLQIHNNSLTSEEALGIYTIVMRDRVWVQYLLLALLGLTVSQIEMQLPPRPSTLTLFMLVEQQAALSRRGQIL